MRLLNHVEGLTEETFTNEILSPHLLQAGYETISARLIGNARQRGNRGGTRAWTDVKKDIIRHLRSDRGGVATTMIDYYALPASGQKEWPGRARANNVPFSQKASTVQDALLADLAGDMGGDFKKSRFVPFVVMHEFEGLLFSDCKAFARGIGQDKLARKFEQIKDQFATPEHINDSEQTAPSA